MVAEADILDALKDCFDPEIPVNIVDLGLVYDVDIEEKNVLITMTLTGQGCPMSAQISSDVTGRLRALEGIEEAGVNIVWDPPWNPSMMSEAAKEKLGF